MTCIITVVITGMSSVASVELLRAKIILHRDSVLTIVFVYFFYICIFLTHDPRFERFKLYVAFDFDTDFIFKKTEAATCRFV